MKSIVAYFSASGTTARLARAMADAAGAELFEIVPVQPYTNAELRWTNPLARCNREKIGKKDVPIASRVENMEQYDLVLLGFPIWYLGAPNIIETFLKDYDLKGKKIALFATSGGSDIGKTAARLQPLTSGTITAAKLFDSNENEAVLREWVESL